MNESTFNAVYSSIQELKEKGGVIAAIDGRCAAGKTTLAARLGNMLDCPVIHMDHFFLRPAQRTQDRMNEPGGNVDRERFYSDVLSKLRDNKPFSYRPFDCGTMELADPVDVPVSSVYIVEGSYCCHPMLFPFYDLRVFLSVSKDEQLRRIALRGGEQAVTRFRELWIPLEEHYFNAFGIADHCELRFDT